MVYQKIENAVVETTKHKNAFGIWCWYIYINGRSAGLDCLEKDNKDNGYSYTIWYSNGKYCKSFQFDSITQAKKWFSENCYIGICGDRSFGIRIMPESALRYKLADVISWTGRRYSRLKAGTVQGDFTNKIYIAEIA